MNNHGLPFRLLPSSSLPLLLLRLLPDFRHLFNPIIIAVDKISSAPTTLSVSTGSPNRVAWNIKAHLKSRRKRKKGKKGGKKKGVQGEGDRNHGRMLEQRVHAVCTPVSSDNCLARKSSTTG